MTALEIASGRLLAAETLSACRRAGALVLRVFDGGHWRLQMWNGQGVSTHLKFQLLEAQPFALMLLRELATTDDAEAL